MKIRVLVALLFLSMASASSAANYVLTIDGESHDMSLDKEALIKVGENYVSVKLEQKDIFLYTTENFSFEHPKQYSPSKTNLGNGIFQTSMMTPLGSLAVSYTHLTLPTN